MTATAPLTPRSGQGIMPESSATRRRRAEVGPLPTCDYCGHAATYRLRLVSGVMGITPYAYNVCPKCRNILLRLEDYTRDELQDWHGFAMVRVIGPRLRNVRLAALLASSHRDKPSGGYVRATWAS